MSEVIRKAIIDLSIRTSVGPKPTGHDALLAAAKAQATAFKDIETAVRKYGASIDDAAKQHRPLIQAGKDSETQNAALEKATESLVIVNSDYVDTLGVISKEHAKRLKDERTLTQAVKAEAESVRALGVARRGSSSDLEIHAGANRALARAHNQVNAGLTKGAQGAIQFGRGLAFLSAANEESIQKAVRTVAVFQGTQDIFKGSIATTKSLTSAYHGLKAAQEAMTAAQGAGKSAAALAAAGLGSMNPVIIAGTAALAAGAGAWRLYSNSVDDANKRLEEAKQKMAAVFEGRIDQLQRAGGHESGARAIQRERIDYAKDDQTRLLMIREQIGEVKIEEAKSRLAADSARPDRVSAMATAAAMGSRDPMGEGADRVLALHDATQRESIATTIGLQRERIELLKMEENLVRQMNEQKRNELRNQASASEDARRKAELEKQEAAMEHETDRLLLGYREMVDAMLQKMAEDARRLRQIEHVQEQQRQASRLRGGV